MTNDSRTKAHESTLGVPAVPPLRDGDIYRWQYRGPDVDLRQYGSYHCCSCIAVVRNGRLRDTYWMIGFSHPGDGRSFGVEDLSKLRLTFMGNLSDLEKVPEYQEDYYDNADVVDLNHANSRRGNFYIRKGAKRSQQKMLETARERLEISIGDERRAAEKSKRLRETIARIEAGDTETYI